jgi:hypothetical protein
MVAIINVRITIPLARNFESDELENVLKNFRNFKTKHKRNCSYRVNIGDYGKENLEIKNTSILF